jgi:hypothetical protein
MTRARTAQPAAAPGHADLQATARQRGGARFRGPLRGPTGATPDAFGNMILRVGGAPVLWSCHTDSAHGGGDSGRQRVAVADGTASLRERPKAGCLGADDVAGLWLMLEMIGAGVPGLYVFHRGEEVGGLGSRHIAMAAPETLAGIRYAVAFDRRGTGSIITHQAFGRCCSDTLRGSAGGAVGPRLAPGRHRDVHGYGQLRRSHPGVQQPVSRLRRRAYAARDA